MNFDKDEIITTDGYINFCEDELIELCHIKTDYFTIGKFNWRGKTHPETIKKNVIISHSDISVENNISDMFNLVFCVNNNTTKDNTYSLPLGIPNNSDDLEVLKIIGDKESFLSVINAPVEKNDLVYMNFDISTNLQVRQPIYDHFQKYEWVTKQKTSQTLEGRQDYLISIKKTKFVLCPRGNGVDTHRLWESLYLGAIPIIQYHRTHDICQDLPILFIDKWENITEEYLNSEYEKISNKKFNLEKLKLSYWKTYIKNKILQNV